MATDPLIAPLTKPKPPEGLDDYLLWLVSESTTLLEKFVCYDRAGSPVVDVRAYAADLERYRQWVAELAELRKDAEKWREYCRQYDESRKDDDNDN